MTGKHCACVTSLTMIQSLRAIYEANLVPARTLGVLPVYNRQQLAIDERALFNERWLLKALLCHWRTNPRRPVTRVTPFPDGVSFYAGGYLPAPYPEDRLVQEPLSDIYVEGIVGNFSFAGNPPRLTLDRDFGYVAVFVPVLYDPPSRRRRQSQEFDRLWKTIAGLIKAIRAAGGNGANARLAVLYPEDNPLDFASTYNRQWLQPRVERYISDGLLMGRWQEPPPPDWRTLLANIDLEFATWESVLAPLGNDDLIWFYDRCRQANPLRD